MATPTTATEILMRQRESDLADRLVRAHFLEALEAQARKILLRSVGIDRMLNAVYEFPVWPLREIKMRQFKDLYPPRPADTPYRVSRQNGNILLRMMEGTR